ncbi:MAG TPA: type II toxin-antitoxin system VapC family toxin [Gemmatimonadaceae bacterium]|nr:type II toxin-antitoxin system VapC family toxin [Gemmatimonadaceae bacterium]
MYLLDTNTCVALIRKSEGAERILRRLTRHAVTDVAVAALTVAELEVGVAKSREPARNRARLDQFLLPLQILPFDDSAAAAYGPVRADLEARGLGIGSIDTLLAAQALSLGAVMVTNNTREFERVPGLIVEDWSRRG